ncbi:MAG: glutathione transferase GstA [Acetobacteraceae bacterium]
MAAQKFVCIAPRRHCERSEAIRQPRPRLCPGLLRPAMRARRARGPRKDEELRKWGHWRSATPVPFNRQPFREIIMKLFYSPGACSLSPHIALLEAGLPFSLEKVDLKDKKLESGGDYNGVNGKGYVPTLELDNGQILTEGPAIVQYIADQKPAAGLAPAAGTMERYRLQEWLNFVTSELHKSMGSMFNPAQTPEWKQAVKTTLSKRLDWLSKQLEGKQYLMGDKFSVADAYLFTILGWAPMVGFDLGPWPVIRQYAARVGQRPKVVEAMKQEGLVK